MPSSPLNPDHLRPDDISAFLAAGPRGAPDYVVAHLAGCGECRDEVREVSRLVRPVAPRAMKSGAMVAAAAALVLAAWLGLRPEKPDVDRHRAVPGSAPRVVLLVAPLGPVTRESPLLFTWQGTREAVEYRLTLLDSRGEVIWNRTTVDTVAALPVETSLVPGAAYYWFVDLLQADGSSATSGAREFRVTR